MTPLATVEDLAARLGRDLTTEETARAGALLADASALVRRYTRQRFECPPVTETVTLRARGGEVRLPQRPVRSVDSVLAVAGLAGVADVPLVGWRWDGRDLVHVDACDDVVINLPAILDDVENYRPRSYKVTYQHGYDEVPDDVVAVVCAATLRTLTAPTLAGGVVSETTGGYSYRLADGTAGGVAVTLNGADREALADYRRKSGVSMLRT